MIKKRPIITLDGPAASGKGSLSESLAKELNLFHIETGLFYRSLAKNYLDFKNNNHSLVKFLDKIEGEKFFIKNINKKNLYTNSVTEKASLLAKKNTVRKFILRIQKYYIKNYSPLYNGLILDGRDCGTIIAPEADIKIFLTAKLEIRARRRFIQIYEKRSDVTYENILKDISDRDKRDVKRKNSPLVKAEDAILIDNSKISFYDTINVVKKIIFSKLPYLKN